MMSPSDLWLSYNKEKVVEASCETTRVIVKKLAEIQTIFLKGRNDFTNRIKFELIKLGYNKKFCVYSNLKRKDSSDGQEKIIGKMRKEINKYIKSLPADYGFNCHTFSNKEWLYDVHWYKDKDGTHYMPEKMELVAESELDNKRPGDKSNHSYSAVKYDFQKLLVSNANIRLMIFSIKDKNDLYDKDGLADYFKAAIETYPEKQLPDGSRFLFVCYCKGSVLYKEMFKIKSVDS